MTNNSLAFWLGHYIYIRISSLFILSQSILPMKIEIIRIEKDITPQKIIKRGSTKDIINFLQLSNKLFSKKKR